MKKLGILVFAGCLVVSAQASLTWTGGGNAISLYNEDNWLEDDGTEPDANEINGGTAISADTGTEKLIVISSGTGTPSAAGSYFNIGNNSLTLSGEKTLAFTASGGNDGCVIAKWATAGQVLTVSDGATLSGVDARNFTTVNVDGATVALTGKFSGANSGLTQGISISNGGSVTAASFGLIYDEAITVDGSSSLTVTTTTAVPFTSVDLAVGAKLTLSSRDYFTTHAARIYVDGVSYADDSSILVFAGTTAFAGVTAPPEPELSIITYNIHGGYGPDGEGTPESNLSAFRDNFMNDEDVLCFQEVDGDFTGDCWDVIPDIFTNYPYRFRTINQETSIWSYPYAQTSIVILSKYPFVTTDEELIQTDPAGDKWERHAQHVTIQKGEDVVDIFHFHNTYNFNDNDWEYEKSGMVSFRDYVYAELDISSLDEAENLIMLGDFNLLSDDVVEIIDTPDRKSDGRDHICSVPYFTSEGKYATVTADLSDHPAIWASLDMQAPSPDPLTWATAPAATGSDSIYMAATNAVDFNGVEYYFANTSVTDGSHDSGWQNSPSYTDIGLTESTTYAYTVQTRDKSVNANTSGTSGELSATTDVGNVAPIADDQSVTVVGSDSMAITLSGSDPEGSSLTYSVVSQPTHGTLATNGALPDLTYTPDADYSGADSFTFTVNDGELASTEASVSITVFQPESLPYAESFESGFGAWRQSTDDDHEWTRNSGYTPSGVEDDNTGPNEASDGDWYLYVENHDSDVQYKTASVECLFDLSAISDAQLSFDYHMYGLYIDYLSVDVHNGSTWSSNVWQQVGQAQSSCEAAWSNAVVSLTDYAGLGEVTIRFRSKQKEWHAADTAIDNILLGEVAATAYETWAEAAFAEAEAGIDMTESGNPDSDRFNNLQEWALVLDPLVADEPTVEITASTSNLVAIYQRRNNTGISVDASWASALTATVWRVPGDGLTEEILETNGDVETVSAAVAIDEDHKFIRIGVEG